MEHKDFEFEVPEKNAGVEYLWRFSQMKMTPREYAEQKMTRKGKVG